VLKDHEDPRGPTYKSLSSDLKSLSSDIKSLNISEDSAICRQYNYDARESAMPVKINLRFSVTNVHDGLITECCVILLSVYRI